MDYSDAQAPNLTQITEATIEEAMPPEPGWPPEWGPPPIPISTPSPQEVMPPEPLNPGIVRILAAVGPDHVPCDLDPEKLHQNLMAVFQDYSDAVDRQSTNKRRMRMRDKFVPKINAARRLILVSRLA